MSTYLCEFGSAEGSVRLPSAIQRPNALLERQKALVDLSALQSGLVVRVHRVGGTLAASQVHEDDLA